MINFEILWGKHLLGGGNLSLCVYTPGIILYMHIISMYMYMYIYTHNILYFMLKNIHVYCIYMYVSLTSQTVSHQCIPPVRVDHTLIM